MMRRLLFLSAFFVASCGGGGGAGGNSNAGVSLTPPVNPTGGNTPTQPSVPLTPVSHVSFSDVTMDAGIDFRHGFSSESMGAMVSAGLAVGDYNGDGWLDLYFSQGDAGLNKLYENRSQGGDYQFADVTGAAGATGSVSDRASGGAFVDYDGDHDLDLIIGSVENSSMRVLNNNGVGSFVDATAASGLGAIDRENSIGMTFGDYDQDSDLDLFVSHWTFTENEFPSGSTQHLWRNNGDGSFSDVSDESMISAIISEGDSDYTFSPTFADIDNDGDADLLVVADNTASQVLINDGDVGGGLYAYRYASDRSVLTDDAGMGSSVADFDNDGDLDWFVSSISLGDSVDGRPTEESNAGFNLSGNRLYRNEGDGVFTDQTDMAGVRKGYWGWGSCAADFNNDGYLDIFHVNGMDEPNTTAYLEDPSRLFINNADGSFTEYSEPLGLVDTRSGRGVACFDGDQDGDVDIFIANNADRATLYRNDGGNDLNYLNITLVGNAPNSQAIGARVYAESGGVTQMREVHNGSNYVSQNPTEQHFGFGDRSMSETVRVVWPDGTESNRNNVALNQRLVVTYPDEWSSD